MLLSFVCLPYGERITQGYTCGAHSDAEFFGWSQGDWIPAYAGIRRRTLSIFIIFPLERTSRSETRSPRYQEHITTLRSFHTPFFPENDKNDTYNGNKSRYPQRRRSRFRHYHRTGEYRCRSGLTQPGDIFQKLFFHSATYVLLIIAMRPVKAKRGALRPQQMPRRPSWNADV